MNEANITFIGAGNIATALIMGLIATDYPADKLIVSNPTSKKLQLLHKKLGVHITQNNVEAAENADIIIFAVKPHTMPAVCRELKNSIEKNTPLLISVASGVTTQQIESWLNSRPAVVHAIPNTPLTVRAGATGLFANTHTTEAQREQAEMLFRSAGVAVWVDEEDHIELVLAVSGSGPAYYFLFMEAMQEAAQAMGLSHDMARLLTSQTVLGAARMAMETDQDVMQLRQSITSPNGTTAAAIRVFETGNIRKVMADAMQAAYNRSKEMSAEIDEQNRSA